MNSIKQISLIATCFAFVVIVMGAYVRLSDAGLGCPDWPGCYGKLIVSDSHDPALFPDSQLDSSKAWKEMIHRYLVPPLGIMILIIVTLSFAVKKSGTRFISILLLGVLVFQALLGMWTVTLKLHPLIVMSHLLGGFATLSLLWLIYLRCHSGMISAGIHLNSDNNGSRINSFRDDMPWKLAIISLILLILQIMLGGWTSSNYASLACPDFPKCLGSWMPPLHVLDSLKIFGDFTSNYEGGLLNPESRVTIHMLHRIGALINFILIHILAIKLMKSGMKKLGLACLLLLLTQITLGILNVLLLLPTVIALAHTGTAALLLLALVTINFLLCSSNRSSNLTHS